MKRPPGTDKLARARRLRREMTDAERLLWSRLRNRQLRGFKFRAQMWLCGYIAYFACPEVRLVLEADGGQHDLQRGYDTMRDAALAREGYRVLRFWNNDILTTIDGVLLTIAQALPPPSHAPAARGPLPLPEAGEGI